MKSNKTQQSGSELPETLDGCRKIGSIRKNEDLVARWHLDEPFWRSSKVWGESLFFLKAGDAPPEAALLFIPEQIDSLTSATGTIVYSPETDFEVCASERKIRLKPGSSIPWLDTEELFRRPEDPLSIPHRAGDAETCLYFSEGTHFHDRQAAVTYRRSESWNGLVPELQCSNLQGTSNRIDAKDALSVFVMGDSITAGANASKATGVLPFQPPYPELFADMLEHVTGCHVTVRNYAVGGRDTRHGVALIPEAIAHNPDLLVVAYGMNDAAANDPGKFRDRIGQIIESVHAACPETEFLLVSPMRGNPEWKHTGADRFPPLRDVLTSFCGEGVALVDMTSLWDDLLKRKTFHDITGNGVNHPNDFGHRLYAQMILDTLLKRQAPIV